MNDARPGAPPAIVAITAVLLTGYLGLAVWGLASPSSDPQRGMAQGCLMLFTVCVLGLAGAILLAPLLYCVLGLVLDVINLAVPMPDLLGWAGNVVDAFVNPRPGAGLPLWALPFAAAPGLVVFVLALHTLRRAFAKSPLSL